MVIMEAGDLAKPNLAKATPKGGEAHGISFLIDAMTAPTPSQAYIFDPLKTTPPLLLTSTITTIGKWPFPTPSVLQKQVD